MTTATRTFDCPWCGAIIPVPVDHLGEHLKCAECGQATKVTEHNTSTLRPTETPPDAPHLTGDRTFDCPWCGAISDVPSSHIGERFTCAECHKDTKLTATNTQRAGVTAPPPEAPHVETGPRPGVWIGIAVVAACVLAYFGLRSPKEEGTPGAVGETSAKGPSTAGSNAAGPNATGSKDAGGGKEAGPKEGSTGVEPAPAAPTVPTPGAPAVPPVAPETPIAPEAPPVAPTAPAVDVAKTRALAAVAEATGRLSAATFFHTQAVAAVTDWTQQHPGAAEALADLPALEEVTAQADLLRSDAKLFPAPDQPTPEQARAYDAAVVVFVGASPDRVRVAEKALSFLRADLYGREVAGVSSWQGIHFYGPGFQRAASTMLGSAKAVASPVPEALVRAEADARRALQEAQAALATAKAAADALPAEGGAPPAPAK